jgi:6-phosphofructokinase 1
MHLQAQVILEAKKSQKIGKVYAGKNGILGALREELIDTSKESKKFIESLKYRPGGVFGSCRYKLKSIEENLKEYKRLIEVFQAHNIGYFFYNGGNDSADTALKISQISNKLNYPSSMYSDP